MRNKRRLTKHEPISGSRSKEFPMSRRTISDEQIQQTLPNIAMGCVGALVTVSFLLPADARSVYTGDALAQNLGWLLLALVTMVAARYNGWIVATRRSWFVAAGVVWLGVTCQVADLTGNGRVAWNGFWQIVAIGLCFWIVSILARHLAFRKMIVWLILSCCVAESTIGIHQLTVGFERVRHQYLADPDGMLRQQGIDAPPGSVQRMRFENRLLYSNEATGSFALSNSLATTLGAAVILGCGCLGTILVKRVSGTGPRGLLATMFIPLASVLLIVVCFLMTKSRSGIIAVLISGIVYALLDKPWRKHALLRRWFLPTACTLVAGCVGLGTWFIVSGRIVLSEAWKSFAFRLDYWVATWRMNWEHPWFGVGLGNFQSYYPRYKLDRASEIIGDPHNWMLDIAASISIPLGIALSGWVFCILGMRCSKPGNEPSQSSNLGAASAVERSEIKGAVLGSIGCLGLMAMTGQAMEFDVALVSWLSAAAYMWSAMRWGKEEVLSPNLLRSAILSMVIALLASGSWQASGIAIPLACMMAVFQAEIRGNLAPSREGSPNTQELPVEELSAGSKFRRWRPWLPSAVIAVGLALFLVQTWRPVSLSWTLMQQSGRGRDYQERLNFLERAADADRLDPVPLVVICQLLGQEIAGAQSPSQLRGLAALLSSAINRLLANDSVGHLNWQLAGDTTLTLAGARQRLGEASPAEQESLEKAEEFYSQAAERYPGSIQLILQNSVVKAALGHWDAAFQELARAESLDQLVAEDDQKLVNQLIWLPYQPEQISGAGVARSHSGSPWAQAEPLVNWMRTRKATGGKAQ